MAAKYYKKDNEHAFKALSRDIKEGSVPRLVLLCGQEEYLIHWYAGLLADHYVTASCKPIDLVCLEGESLTLKNIQEGLETVSLMSERKVVTVPDFAPAAGKAAKGFSDTDISELIAYFAQIPDGSMLLITAADPKDAKTEREKNKFRQCKVRKAVEKHGRVYDFEPLKGKDLRSFIEKRFQHAGKFYVPSVVELIIAESGYDNRSIDYSLYHLENDLQKIIAHSGSSREITASDVRGVLAVNPENDIFAMLDAIGRKRKDEAFRLLHNLLAEQSPKPVFKLLYSITGQLELILTVKEMREEGMSKDAMKKKLGIHQYKLQKAIDVTGLYTMEELREILSAAYQVDEHIKTGLFDGTLALEYFIAGI